MATTSLFIEILVVGAIADIWLGLIILAFFPITFINLPLAIETVAKLSTILTVPFLAITYILGGLILFLSEQILEPLFQTKFKNQFFGNAKVNYGEVRATFYQKASEQIVEDLNFDRQILRISRSSILNFLLLAVVLFAYIKSYPVEALFGIATSIFVIALSFWQWKERYELSYNKMLNTYKILRQKTQETRK